MTPLDIPALRELLAKATPGPCAAGCPGTWTPCSFMSAANWQRSHVNAEGHVDDALTICRGMTGPNRENNADFIAAVANALPALLDTIDALTAIVEREAAQATPAVSRELRELLAQALGAP